jgi:hypothetical protein
MRAQEAAMSDAAVDSTAEDLDAPTEPRPTYAITTIAAPAHAVTPNVTAGELVQRLAVIREAMANAMQEGIDYGRIPGVDKPTLFKPGAEKLGVLFQLDVQLASTKTWGPGEHLTVETKATVYHAPTGQRLGFGEGLATTREKKHAKRKQERLCPSCGAAAVIAGKAEYGGGWLCWKKRDGCGAKFSAGDPQIEDQEVGTIENPELPDSWNNVVKMAAKRARVDAVLAVTGASALFTQDAEDLASPEAPLQDLRVVPEHVATVKRLVRRNKVKTAELRRMLRAVGIGIHDGESPVPVVDGLTVEQAAPLIEFLEREPVPTGGSDVPADASGFEHPSEQDPLPEHESEAV